MRLNRDGRDAGAAVDKKAASIVGGAFGWEFERFRRPPTERLTLSSRRIPYDGRLQPPRILVYFDPLPNKHS